MCFTSDRADGKLGCLLSSVLALSCSLLCFSSRQLPLLSEMRSSFLLLTVLAALLVASASADTSRFSGAERNLLSSSAMTLLEFRSFDGGSQSTTPKLTFACVTIRVQS